MHKSDGPTSNYLERMKAAEVMRDIYKSPNGACAENADILISQLRFCMYLIAKQSKQEADQSLAILKSKGLFPFEIPKESTITNTYQTTRRDMVGKIYNWICLHVTTTYGYYLLRLWRKLRH